MLAIENRSDWPIHISTNIKWHENEENWYRLKEFDLNPGENTGPLAFCYQTEAQFYRFFDNYYSAHITFSTAIDGREVMKKWAKSISEEDSYAGKKFFSAKDYSVSERNIDGKSYFIYSFIVDNNMVNSW